MLRLQGEPFGLAIRRPGRTDHGPIEIVAGVDLQSWLGGEAVEYAARSWVVGARRKRYALTCLAVQHEIMVVAMCIDHLLVGAVQSGANGHHLPEVERGAFHSSHFAGRNLIRTRRCVAL